MKVTQEADYALRIAICLAQQDSGVLVSSVISERMSISGPVTLKILKLLCAAGVVMSRKGSHGGYMLAKDAKEISVKRVIEAVDGPISISRCIDDKYCCTRMGSEKSLCAMHRVFCSVNKTVANRLDRVSIADVASGNIDFSDI